MNINDEYDVIVVGAGPAGTSTARECAKNGLSVLVLEKRPEIGSPKRCGEGLSSNSIQKLNLNIPKNCIRQEIHGGYVYAPNGKRVEIKFPDSQGVILERKLFDKWLAEESARAGARIVTKAKVYDLIIENEFIKGVKVNLMGRDLLIRSKVVVAADGVESLILRKAGVIDSKKPNLVDSCFQYEMANIKLENPNMIYLFLGNEVAPRGYVWIFPKGKDVANVGIGISGDYGVKKAKEFLDEFIEKNENLKNGSYIENNAGCVPVGDLLQNMVGNGIIGVGDCVNQVNPIHGGGIAESIFAARIAADVITDCIKNNDVSAKALDKYNKRWWKERGERLRRIERIRETFEKMSDEQMNDLADVLSGEDLENFARGKGLTKFAKILLKYKMKGLARFLGL